MTIELTRTDLDQLGQVWRGGFSLSQDMTGAGRWSAPPDGEIAEAVRDIVERHIVAQRERDRKLAVMVARQVVAMLDERAPDILDDQAVTDGP